MRTLAFSVFMLATFSVAQAQLPENYQSLLASQKQEILWKQIESSKYPGALPTQAPGILEILGKANINWLLPAFTRVSDEMITVDTDANGKQVFRPKIFHPYGSAVKIKWVAAKNQPYTGVFETGGIGILRISSASAITKSGMTPGMAIKILLDGQPSVNLHVMKGLTANSADCDPFSQVFTNQIEGLGFPASLLLGGFNKTVHTAGDAQSSPFKMVVDHFARVNTSSPISPDVIMFKPSAKANAMSFGCDSDWRNKLSVLESGDVLYDVYAQSPEIKIGEIVLDSEFVSSTYEDQGLYFQHNLL